MSKSWIFGAVLRYIFLKSIYNFLFKPVESFIPPPHPLLPSKKCKLCLFQQWNLQTEQSYPTESLILNTSNLLGVNE